MWRIGTTSRVSGECPAKPVGHAGRHGWRGEEVVGSTTKPRRVPVGQRLWPPGAGRAFAAELLQN